VEQLVLHAAVAAGVDPDACDPQQRHHRGGFPAELGGPLELTDSKKTQYNNEWRTYRERNVQLKKLRCQAFSLILGQCTQLLQDKVKQDTDFYHRKHVV
jgi:hypothetical protein